MHLVLMRIITMKVTSLDYLILMFFSLLDIISVNAISDHMVNAKMEIQNAKINIF